MIMLLFENMHKDYILELAQHPVGGSAGPHVNWRHQVSRSQQSPDGRGQLLLVVFMGHGTLGQTCSISLLSGVDSTVQIILMIKMMTIFTKGIKPQTSDRA